MGATSSDGADGRLHSLDVLRGLDMMVLVGLSPIVKAANSAWGLPEGFMRQWSHYWGGFTFYDIIMPLFIFMCGAAVPLAMRRRMTPDGRPGKGFFRHIAVRFAMLWVFGMAVQGNLLTLDPMKISPFNNTLQAIAVGYVAVALAQLLPRLWHRVAAAALCVAVYGVLMAACGDYSKDGNVAQVVEQWILRHVIPDGSSAFATHGYTWFLTSLMFAAMTFAGSFATEILGREGSVARKAGMLAGYGVAMLVAGWVLSPWVPVIKHVYTVSFSLLAMGWCVLALAALYALVDGAGFRRWTGLIELWGRTALTAYMTWNLFRPALKSAAGVFTVGLERLSCDKVAAFATTVLAVAFVHFIIVLRNRLKSTRQKAPGPNAGA